MLRIGCIVVPYRQSYGPPSIDKYHFLWYYFFMKPGLDLSEVIYGTIFPDDGDVSLEEGQRTTLLLFQAGGTAMKPSVIIESVVISELGDHLEDFIGRDDTHPDFDDDLSRGSILRGIYNHRTSTVFITGIDGVRVAQEPEFYNARPSSDR